MKAEQFYQWWLERVYHVQRWERSVRWIPWITRGLAIVVVVCTFALVLIRGDGSGISEGLAVAVGLVSAGEWQWHKRRAEEWAFEASVVSEALEQAVRDERSAAGY